MEFSELSQQRRSLLRGLTFELSRPGEAGRLGPGGDNATKSDAVRAKVPCLAGSALERGVGPHWRRAHVRCSRGAQFGRSTETRVRSARPISLLRGTVPMYRESWLLSLLSPSMK